MKVPIVVSKDVGCNSEFIRDWENGVLLDPFSNVGWAEAIIKLLKDNKLCATIGSNGYLTCRDKFDIKQTARAFEELYGQLAR
jgi:glycosyltransferase involved in cell wall biosynthesis